MRPILKPRLKLTSSAAREEQSRLADRVRSTRLARRSLRVVAGCDAAQSGSELIAAVVVMSFPELELLETRVAAALPGMPYIPGLLSFRELPALLSAFARLDHRPQVVLCDAQGRAHPRHLGLASHLGVVLDVPTIGCAKSRLIGTHREPAAAAGASVPLNHAGKVIGRVLRTRTDVRPLFVSVGHRVTLTDAVWLTQTCCRGFRLPEPTRQAHIAAGRAARERG